MNEIIKVLVEHSAEFAILDPLLKGATRSGIAVAKDWIGPERLEAIQDLFKRAEATLHRKGIKPEPPPLSVLLPLLEAAQDESREELRDLWAKLLAAASDPSFRKKYRREFVDIAKQLEPMDALVLPILASPGRLGPTRLQYIVACLGTSEDEAAISFRNLEKLELVSSKEMSLSWENRPAITALGRRFLAAVAD